jgi:nitrate reductase NapE component
MPVFIFSAPQLHVFACFASFTSNSLHACCALRILSVGTPGATFEDVFLQGYVSPKHYETAAASDIVVLVLSCSQRRSVVEPVTFLFLSILLHPLCSWFVLLACCVLLPPLFLMPKNWLSQKIF